jgi:GntR family transcriptional regulator/MocR family aminotransferase
MDPHVSLGGRGEFAAQIYRQIRAAILDGRLAAGERLPPSREFAQRLSVSRNTVALAYERLTAEGLLVARVGAGTYVCAQRLAGPGVAPAPRQSRPGPAPASRPVRPREIWRALPPPDRRSPTPLRYDFRVGLPDPALFPLQTWRRLVAHELRSTTIQSGQYGDPAGHAGLRAAIARYIGVSRSVNASAEDLVITYGAQQAVDLIARVLLEPGNSVAVEEPGYPPVRALLRSHSARVVGVPVDCEGIDVSAIPASARLVYTTPSHQYPLGTPMSLARRAALLDWARSRDAVIIEDDYDSEFRFAGRPLDPLQSLDRDGRVVYVGSFSKTMLPMLRVGFLVAPASLLPALRTAKRLSDWHSDTTTQAALARFIDDGLLGRHIRRASREYGARHRLVEQGLREHLGQWLELVPSVAGLHLAARHHPHRTSPQSTLAMDDVVRRANAAGIAISTLTETYADTPPQPGLVLGYGGIAQRDIMPALHRLAGLFA